MSTIVAPSLLSADFLNLERDIEMLNRSEADWIHLDIMDGVFVPNISFGFAVTNLLKKISKKPLDTHLMIVQPEKFIKEIAATGTTYMNVHFEACTHLHRVVQQIRDNGMKPAVTLNPHTPVSLLGQNASALIQVDGGVNLETGRKLVDAGADALVAGSFVFSSENPEETIRQLKAL